MAQCWIIVNSLHILWLGTRLPYPIRDGGALLAATTIDALQAAGHRLTVLVPAEPGTRHTSPRVRWITVDARPLPWARAFLRARREGVPATIVRHRHAAMAVRLREFLEHDRPDVIHVEQLHASSAAEPARRSGVPVILRAHNVESDVWRTAVQGRLLTGLLHGEANRLAAYEARAVADATRVITLSPHDRDALARLSARADIDHVPPIGPPTAFLQSGRLEGRPACVWIGSAGWPVNDEARRWLLAAIWPEVHAGWPDARLHVFGAGTASTHGSGSGIVSHPHPADSAEAFAGDVVLLPLRTAVGIRMRVLEAWARGVPVIGTAAALRGLACEPDGNALVAETPAAWADAVRRVATDPALRDRLVAGGRRTLSRDHGAEAGAAALVEVYRAAMRAAAAR